MRFGLMPATRSRAKAILARLGADMPMSRVAISVGPASSRVNAIAERNAEMNLSALTQGRR